ncbi:hypothetical protein F4679DRAFT_593920 [Xylaria curta]|nr:hypothetical protein F4679DRAFT_593920 [Xylaria curta]
MISILKRIRRAIRKASGVPGTPPPHEPPESLEDSPPPYESMDSNPICTEDDFWYFAFRASPKATVEVSKAEGSQQAIMSGTIDALEIAMEEAFTDIERRDIAFDSAKYALLMAATTSSLASIRGYALASSLFDLYRALGSEENNRMGVLYHRIQHVYNFYSDAFSYDFPGDNNKPIIAIAHVGQNYINAFWSFKNQYLVFGDGDNIVVGGFIELAIIAYELTHCLISAKSNLRYKDESGAMNEHLADVMAILCIQHRSQKNAFACNTDPAGGTTFLHPFLPTLELKEYRPGYMRSMADLSTGWMSQPRNYKDFVKTNHDNGGVHINSGSPNFAFYTAAQKAGSVPWAGVGKVWFLHMIDPLLGSDCSFAAFAAATLRSARMVDPALVGPIDEGWSTVDVPV